MRVVSLASGSSGNSLFIEAGPLGRTRLLIDAGLSGRVLHERLQAIGVHPSQLQGILITHEHSDHVLGLPTLLRRYNTPIITAPLTYDAIKEGMERGSWHTDSGKLLPTTTVVAAPTANGYMTEEELHTFESSIESAATLEVLEESQPLLLPGSTRMIGDIEVTSFPTSHDAAAPCGYFLQAGGCRICVATDTGEVTDEMLQKIKEADLLVLESNHDRVRLLRGPYPIVVKQRILSPFGHLSNDQAADAILQTWRNDSVRWVWLAHLSRTNNTPALALKTLQTRLQTAGANPAQLHISVLPPGMGASWNSRELWTTPDLWEMGNLTRGQ